MNTWISNVHDGLNQAISLSNKKSDKNKIKTIIEFQIRKYWVWKDYVHNLSISLRIGKGNSCHFVRSGERERNHADRLLIGDGKILLLVGVYIVDWCGSVKITNLWAFVNLFEIQRTIVREGLKESSFYYCYMNKVIWKYIPNVTNI